MLMLCVVKFLVCYAFAIMKSWRIFGPKKFSEKQRTLPYLGVIYGKKALCFH